MTNYVISLIRTIVPTAVGAVAAYLVTRFGITIDSASLELALVSVLTGAYYAAARALEARYPWAGFLLGYKAPPTYAPNEPDTTAGP